MLVKFNKKRIYARCRCKLRRSKIKILCILILLFFVCQITHFFPIQNSVGKPLSKPLKEPRSKLDYELPPKRTLADKKDDRNPAPSRRNRSWGTAKRRVISKNIRPPPPLSFEAPIYPAETQPPKIRHKRPKAKTTDVKPTTTATLKDGLEDAHADPLSSKQTNALSKESPINSLGEEPFPNALETFYQNLLIKNLGGNPEQLAQNFTDIEAGPRVALPYDPHYVEDPALWRACDPRNTSFSIARDQLCQKYLGDLNNMRYIQSMASKILEARTIKMRIHYAHGNLTAIVKISQFNFVYEAVSESVAYAYDRVLNFSRIPITMIIPLPLDFIRAATSHSPLLSQWFNRHVVLYNFTRENFVSCPYYDYENISAYESLPTCAIVSVQVLMKDVHELSDTFLALPFLYDEKFENKYYVPGGEKLHVIKRARLRAIGELQDRFIFDFITGNTDRGMEGRNSFVYGGCSAKTACALARPEKRHYGVAKYAYLDQGSSFHSHQEPEKNPFTGSLHKIQICRFRQSTYDHLKRYESRAEDNNPLVSHVEKMLKTEIFKIVYDSVLRKTQMRLNKVVAIVENCLKKFPAEEVFSIPDYDKVRIAEEDVTLDDE